jgi:hypothetical protein
MRKGRYRTIIRWGLPRQHILHKSQYQLSGRDHRKRPFKPSLRPHCGVLASTTTRRARRRCRARTRRTLIHHRLPTHRLRIYPRAHASAGRQILRRIGLGRIKARVEPGADVDYTAARADGRDVRRDEGRVLLGGERAREDPREVKLRLSRFGDGDVCVGGLGGDEIEDVRDRPV